jgi:hypothetical protein
VTYKTRFGLDDYIYCTLTYIHTTRELQEIERYRYSAHFSIHRHTVTKVLSLDYRILTTDLKLSHYHFKSHTESPLRSLIPYLTLFCSCQYRRLDSVQFLCLFSNVLYSYYLSARIPRKTPSSIVKEACLQLRYLHTIVACLCCGNVFTDPLPSNGYKRHNMNKSRKMKYILDVKNMIWQN